MERTFIKTRAYRQTLYAENKRTAAKNKFTASNLCNRIIIATEKSQVIFGQPHYPAKTARAHSLYYRSELQDIRIP